MAREKVSITVDRTKVDRARELVEARSVSDLIDVALTRLISAELERRHVQGYERLPPDAESDSWAALRRDNVDIADDVDWATLYGIKR